ncbi:uncharacterized protein LOC135342435 [Halichondria panicea]|uniref:uncharacterized protein LOC135342435 n=1 Tax=Halichondria panicea TaxID=6063 RepID=UPI00312BA667
MYGGEILLPLVALDKINLIEGYIEESKTLQEEFVALLDDLCEPGTTQTKINRFVSECSLIPKDSMDELLSKCNCKLNLKQLYRLAHRMVTKYNLDLSKFSHIHSRWSTASLHHLLQKRYVEGAITEGNINDLLESVVEDNTALQFQLVKELVYHNDIAAAVYWAGRCELPVQQLPFSVQIQLEAQSLRV